MMNSRVSKFLQDFKDIVEENQKFLFYTRGIEFQRKSVEELESLMKMTLKLKEKTRKKKDEESSNILLSLENLLSAYINELKMLIFLKEDNMDKAWESLVMAQSSLRSSFQSNDIVLSFDGKNHVQKLLLIEKLFFPPSVFQSIDVIVESSECSICGKEYGTCTHVKGRPYMGTLCYRIVTKIREMREVSYVDEPANKMCRITAFVDKGSWRDILTWRIMKNPKKT